MNRDSLTSQMKPWNIFSKLACCFLVTLLGSSPGSAVRPPGQNQIALSQPLIVKWRYQSDQTSNLTPAADKTTVFLPLAAGVLIALNAADGKLSWKAEAGGEFSAAPTTDEVEIQLAEASADEPAAALPTEAASQSTPAATEPATNDAATQGASEPEAAPQPAPAAAEPAAGLSDPAPNEWPHGTRVMVRKGKSWREATIISRLDPDHWRAEYPGGGSGMFREADIRTYDPKRDPTPAKQPRRAKATATETSSRSRYRIDPETIAAGRLPNVRPS